MNAKLHDCPLSPVTRALLEDVEAALGCALEVETSHQDAAADNYVDMLFLPVRIIYRTHTPERADGPQLRHDLLRLQRIASGWPFRRRFYYLEIAQGYLDIIQEVFALVHDLDIWPCMDPQDAAAQARPAAQALLDMLRRPEPVSFLRRAKPALMLAHCLLSPADPALRDDIRRLAPQTLPDAWPMARNIMDCLTRAGRPALETARPLMEELLRLAEASPELLQPEYFGPPPPSHASIKSAKK